MEVILVPGPPKEAFNKNRRMSDLIKKQVEHFKHLEHGLRPEVRGTLPQHAIVTEDDAARYIAPFTRMLLGKRPAAKQTKMKTMPATAGQGLALAAAASDAGGKSKTKSPAELSKPHRRKK